MKGNERRQNSENFRKESKNYWQKATSENFVNERITFLKPTPVIFNYGHVRISNIK